MKPSWPASRSRSGRARAGELQYAAVALMLGRSLRAAQLPLIRARQTNSSLLAFGTRVCRALPDRPREASRFHRPVALPLRAASRLGGRRVDRTTNRMILADPASNCVGQSNVQ